LKTHCSEIYLYLRGLHLALDGGCYITIIWSGYLVPLQW